MVHHEALQAALTLNVESLVPELQLLQQVKAASKQA